MAFHHFHKHSKKYLLVATVAMVFSLLVFSIPTAIQAFTGSATGSANSTWVRFETSAGETVELTRGEWAGFHQRAMGFGNLALQLQAARSPLMVLVADLANPETFSALPLVQAILLEEANAMGIVVPETLVEQYFQIFLESVQAVAQQAITKGLLKSILASVRLDEASFRQAMREALKTYVYRQTVRGAVVHDPVDILRHFQQSDELISMDYVEFSYDQYRNELAANLPDDAELKNYYEGLGDGVLRQKFATPERLTLELAVVNADEIDLAGVPAKRLENFAEPSDDQLLDRYRRDSIRYGASEEPVQAITDLPEETREKVLRDMKVREVMLSLRRSYEDFVAAQESEAAAGGATDAEEEAAGAAETPREETAGEGGAAGEDGEKADAGGLSEEERLAAQSADFRRLAESIGLEFQRVENVTREELAELDPPKDPSMQFIVGGLREPGSIQSVDAARDRSFGYLVRLVERVPQATKSFAEAREDLIEYWLDKKAGERSKEAAEEFRREIREKAIADVDPDLVSKVEEKYKKQREQPEEELSDLELESRLEELELERFRDLAALVHPQESSIFEAKIEDHSLVLHELDSFRRSEGQQTYFTKLAEGAEAFLKRQDNRYGNTPKLLGYAQGSVSEVLVDPETNSSYVARITERSKPTFEMMSPKDRVEAQQANEMEILREQPRIPYLNMFSLNRLLAEHSPQIRVVEPEEPPAEADGESSAEDEVAEGTGS